MFKPKMHSDPYSSKCTESGGQIDINFKFSGSGATPEVISGMRESIQCHWNAAGFTINTSVGGSGATAINVVGGKGRSFMQGNNGTWYADAPAWEAAHETGHIMRLIDQYDDVASGTLTISNPRPGFENTIMGQYRGQVTPQDRQAALEALGCDCNCTN